MTEPEADCLKPALWYTQRYGWQVIPLRPREKVPILNDWVKRATADAAQIGLWFASWRTANLGLACGQTSGVWVLDIDPRHQGDESLDDLIREHGPLPQTVCQCTGGGGVQYFWRWPQGRSVGNRTAIRPGIDVRGAGGQVVLPPSIHPSGKAYFWDLSPHEQELADAPAWLLDLVSDRPTAARPSPPPENLTEPIPEGVRNDTLFSRACRMRRAGASESVILADLREINSARCRPPLDAEELLLLAKQAAKYRSGPGKTGVHPTPAPAPVASKQPGTAAGEFTGTGASGGGGNFSPPGGGGAGQGGPGARDHYPLNESGNALRFFDLFAADVRYCHTWGCWMTWAGSHWEKDTTRQVDRWMALAIERSVLAELERCEDDQIAKELRAWLKKNLNDRAIMNSVHRAEALEGLSTVAGDYDRDQEAFNVANGTIELRTGKLRPHDRLDLITRSCPDLLDTNARDEWWEKYLQELTGKDQALVDFLARAAGYSMSGETKRQVTFMMSGPGGTGKSTFTATIQAIIGSYAYSLPFETFLTDRAGQKKWSLANCSQMRLVVCEESGESRRFSSEVVKQVTGGTPIEVEAKFGQPFSFVPRFKVWFVTNDPPWVSDTDSGFWRRMRLINCEHVPEIPNPDLPDHLTRNPQARRAVLAWMVRGAMDYYAQGLAEPPVVLNASKTYRAEQDPLKDWLDEETVWGETETVSREDAIASYKAWALANNMGRTIGPKGFYDRLRKRGADNCWLRMIDRTKVRGFRGVRLRRSDEIIDEPTTPPHGGYKTATQSPEQGVDCVAQTAPSAGSGPSGPSSDGTELGAATSLPHNRSSDCVADGARHSKDLDQSATQSADSRPRYAREDPSSILSTEGREGSFCAPVAEPKNRRPRIGDPPTESENIFPDREPGADENELPWTEPLFPPPF